MKIKPTKEDTHWLARHALDIFAFNEWLIVLSSPRILAAMQRVPPREHLVRMLDAYLPYARGTCEFAPQGGDFRLDPREREARALELRAAIERWSSPEISREITEAARALLRADGEDATDEAWEAHACEPPPNDYLRWPEGVPLELSGQEPPVVSCFGPIWGAVPRPPSPPVEDTGVDASPTEEDYADVFHFQQWLQALACPLVLQVMRRMPTREHLLIMLDAYLPYARSERRLRHGRKVWYPDPQKREARALELRAAIERWSSPEISREITEAARALLREDGIPETDEEWETYEIEPGPPVEDSLLWPEHPSFPRKRMPQP